MNIERLCEYAEAFNGCKIVLLKTGPNTIEPGTVKQQFAQLGEVEFIEMPNDPELGEVAGFMEGLGRLVSLNPDEATFYAHTKGTTLKSLDSIEVVREWRDTMYQGCLSDIDLIERVLQQYASCGCFLVPIAPSWIEWARWQYAGTFFWFNHAKLFSVPGGHYIHQGYYGVESYLGRHLPLSEAYCLHGTLKELDSITFRMTGEHGYAEEAFELFSGLAPSERL